ncbi:hypothetical protein GCM10022222_35100 [Amycolatopsis ultiminotia]|uniref:HTH tetR-type domain-containing protein n=1 Tax=Amycolatopsis ultiminotia TaxID=543629 RepID=A0ABP6WA89_9PSEU
MNPVAAGGNADTDRRGRLIDAARLLFSERPYEKVTTTEIARTADVAYGLIAHHFDNKRGLYLAVMKQIAAEITANHQKPPRGDTPLEQLHSALVEHITYIDRHASGFLAIMRGGLGADPDLRKLVDETRWAGALRVLHATGVTNPPATLRAALRGWVGYLDELMVDRIENRDLAITTLADLAAAALTATLQKVTTLDPHTGIDPAITKAIAPTTRR